MDTNFNKGEGVTNLEAQGTTSTTTSLIPISLILSSTIETSRVDTSTTLPPFHTPISSSLPASTISTTYSNIMNQPVTSLFSSQSTKGETSIPEDDHDADDVMVSFIEIQFDPEEDNIPDQIHMSGKQIKILNHKLNSLLQIQDDIGGRNTIIGIEELRLVAKEHHLLFIEEVKKVQESVNLNVKALKFEMSKEVAKIEHNHSILHDKIDVVVDAIKKLVEHYISFTSKFHVNIDVDSKMLSSLETNLKAELSPILKLENLMPTDAPPVKLMVQGGDKRVGSSNDLDQGKVLGKVISTQIPTSLPIPTSTTSTTVTLRPLTKGIVIGATVRGSSSKPTSTKQDKGDR
ncbi:unnamed protein product [Lactuca saligna]|uniref:Uncharacterized protein n=1 Tax=Lactuca saligna TaxID=75948 RepID=A0AA36E8C5_LACSI|nr:unnamed protein product [Lactuca saligna]